MAAWQVLFSEQAKKDFSNLDTSIRKQVAQRIDWFVENFNTLTQTPLHDIFKGSFKLRAGDWRVAYTLHPEELLIKIYTIEHRSKIYKKRK